MGTIAYSAEIGQYIMDLGKAANKTAAQTYFKSLEEEDREKLVADFEKSKTATTEKIVAKSVDLTTVPLGMEEKSTPRKAILVRIDHYTETQIKKAEDEGKLYLKDACKPVYQFTDEETGKESKPVVGFAFKASIAEDVVAGMPVIVHIYNPNWDGKHEKVEREFNVKSITLDTSTSAGKARAIEVADYEIKMKLAQKYGVMLKM